MKINVLKTGPENLCDLINATLGNGKRRITLADVTLGPVTAVRAGTGLPNPTHNTIFTLTGIPAAGITGSRKIRYRRLTMTENVANPQLTYDVDDSTTSAALHLTICTALRLIPTDVEITQPLVRPTNGNTSVQIIREKGRSYMHVGQQTLQLVWAPK